MCVCVVGETGRGSQELSPQFHQGKHSQRLRRSRGSPLGLRRYQVSPYDTTFLVNQVFDCRGFTHSLLSNALKMYTRARDHCTSNKHVVQLCLNIIKVSYTYTSVSNPYITSVCVTVPRVFGCVVGWEQISAAYTAVNVHRYAYTLDRTSPYCLSYSTIHPDCCIGWEDSVYLIPEVMSLYGRETRIE